MEGRRWQNGSHYLSKQNKTKKEYKNTTTRKTDLTIYQIDQTAWSQITGSQISLSIILIFQMTVEAMSPFSPSKWHTNTMLTFTPNELKPYFLLVVWRATNMNGIQQDFLVNWNPDCSSAMNWHWYARVAGGLEQGGVEEGEAGALHDPQVLQGETFFVSIWIHTLK